MLGEFVGIAGVQDEVLLASLLLLSDETKQCNHEGLSPQARDCAAKMAGLPPIWRKELLAEVLLRCAQQ